MSLSDEEYRELMIKDADKIYNCLYLHGADEYESCWFDCMHPQRPAIRCPYKQMSECEISNPDKVSIERDIEMALRAKRFWEKEQKLDELKEHICDIDDEVLMNKHKNVLSLIGKHDAIMIGTLIAGKYYKDVWSSRSCSGKLSRLVGGDDYMDFYCGSSVYFAMSLHDKNQLHNDFEDMDNLDRK